MTKEPRDKPGEYKTEGGGVGTYVIDYQNTNDPVINNWFRSSPGDIKNADSKIREESKDDFQYRHRVPIDNGNFWQKLNGLINKKINNQQISNIITSFLQQNPDIKITIQG